MHMDHLLKSDSKQNIFPTLKCTTSWQVSQGGRQKEEGGVSFRVKKGIMKYEFLIVCSWITETYSDIIQRVG